MAALFGHGNPLTTQVGQLIERATDGSQASENWGLFMEVCDIINETDEGPKDAIKAIRKRLSQNVGKNYTAVMYTLTQLETCVKNCGKRFHLQVANKDFLHELIKIIGPKNDPPQAVQEKVLSLIQTWADAFRGAPDLKEVEKVYSELKSKGIEFPMTDLDHMAPIYTPARSVPETEQTALNRHRGSSARSTSVRSPQQPQQPPPPQLQQSVPGPQFVGGAPTPIQPNQEQQGKLRRELEVVSGNIRVMSEMLTELTPTSCDPSDLELLQELHRTNRQMQSRLVDLLNHVATEDVTNELLRVNDDMNNVFLRYERFERYRTGQAGTPDQAPAETVPSSVPPASDDHLPPSYDQVVSAPEPLVQASNNPTVGNLIDLGGAERAATSTSDVNVQMAGMNMGSSNGAPAYNSGVPPTNTGAPATNTGAPATNTGAPATNSAAFSDDFDMFAQSRQSFEENKQAPSSGAYTNQQEDQAGVGLGQAVTARTQQEILDLQDKETDYDEMEQWLATQKPQGAGGVTDPVSSSDFDKFLADRASAATDVPSISAATGQQQSRAAPRSNRQLQKEEEDNPLFAL
ncbi:target of Myb protein 1-like isoform X3 [Haliotis rufescens]|uniref:target of Myb protein 1-like isoform X3 n=1 Tax=Haliotis rufescens TaxID=6454 RepID=UPI001EAFA17F|nr:target of Myb protein 1-like isoform X3 [Haliotis rufescens]